MLLIIHLFNFNSIKVRLKLSVGKRLLHLLSYFNSIKVRLKLYNYANAFRAVAEFQFHKGTIKTVVSIEII